MLNVLCYVLNAAFFTWIYCSTQRDIQPQYLFVSLQTLLTVCQKLATLYREDQTEVLPTLS